MTKQLKMRRLTTTTTSTETLMSAPPSLSVDSPHELPLPDIPDHLMAEILCRLPVKSLLQLRCVCKFWNSLITDPKFAMKHLHMSKSTTTRLHLAKIIVRPQIMASSYPLHPVFTTFTATDDPTQLDFPQMCDFIDSCDGMFFFTLDQCFTVLCNPSIRKFKILPSLDIPRVPDDRYRNTLYSIGYDPFIDNYKVIAICCYDYEFDDEGSMISCKTQVKVHTLGTNYWRRIQEFPCVPKETQLGKFVGGTVNWLPHRTHSTSVIVSLDLEKGSYQEIPLPDYGEVIYLVLDVLRDCLCFFCHSGTFTDVWLMKEYGNKDSWTKLFRVPYARRIVYISEDDQVLLSDIPELAAYNARSGGTFKIPTIKHTIEFTKFKVYVNSLVSP